MKLKLRAKIRKEKAKKIRKEGKIPAVLYGPRLENVNLTVEEKEFEKVLKEAGESSLISLEVENGEKKEYLVLIHDFQKDPATDKIIHIDFFQPSLKEKVEAKVPLVFEGEPPAVKMGGTLVKFMTEIEVKATPEKLPREIKVNLEKLKDFESVIVVGDLPLPKGVEVKRAKEEAIARVLPLEKEETIPPPKEQISEEKKE